MKKKILGILLCGVLIIGLTGCGKDTVKKSELPKDDTNTNNKEVSEDKLTLENFKKVMKEHGLSVVDGNCDENNINCLYTATDTRDNRSTTYVFTVYKDEDTATRFWESDLNNLRDSYNVIVKDEKNRKLEYSYGTYGIRTIIKYYSKTTRIHVDNDDSDNKDSLNYVKEVLAEFGYTDNSDTSKNNTSSNNDVIRTKDYTIKYGTYKGTATSGGYTLTSEITISKENMQLETDTCEYAIKDNVIYCKNADAIQIIVTGNNQFTSASGIYTYTLED